MKLNNKMLKGMMLVVPVMSVAACSSQKSSHNADNSAMGASAGIGMDISSNNVSSDEGSRLQIQQELQRNNIVYFDLNKYDIHPEFFQMLDAHANFLRSNPSCKVTIEGHADERGTPEYNIALGEHRAHALNIYLQSMGVSFDQIDMVSYGKEKPIVLGHDEAAYSKNRRAVLVY
ncbi:MAG: peptidoglycan-associated outer membrane lipoprotein Pal [Sodalis sp. Fse]|nr:MAG: peptidoglycan-associated outer membrane lipoprotein Pal [Sodalis sp. Fse]UVK78939.1 MAG: peptidoglycan-associated outer membrane lipoprotein Pal [Sodalis sp. Ffu]